MCWVLSAHIFPGTVPYPGFFWLTVRLSFAPLNWLQKQQKINFKNSSYNKSFFLLLFILEAKIFYWEKEIPASEACRVLKNRTLSAGLVSCIFRVLFLKNRFLTNFSYAPEFGRPYDWDGLKIHLVTAPSKLASKK